MPSQHGVLLAVGIITTHFGDQVGWVSNYPRDSSIHGASTCAVEELSTGLNPAQLCSNILHRKIGGFGVEVKVITQYMTLFDNILHRIRFSKFLAIVAERFDKTGLLQHGRLTLEQVMMRAMSKRIEGNADFLRSGFTKLVHTNFVERCPPAEPFLETLEKGQAPKLAKLPYCWRPSCKKQFGDQGVLRALIKLEQFWMSWVVNHQWKRIPCAHSFVYSIDLRSIIEAARNAEVESVVSRRYGKNAYRIFRFLVKKGCLAETEQISEETLIDKKESAKILYRLYIDGFLHMEKEASLEQQALFLLWRVMENTHWEHVLDDMYHAALNLNQRIAHELELEHEVIIRPRDQLDETQLKRLLRVIKVKTVLEESLLKLDAAVMVFHGF